MKGPKFKLSFSWRPRLQQLTLPGESRLHHAYVIKVMAGKPSQSAQTASARHRQLSQTIDSLDEQSINPSALSTISCDNVTILIIIVRMIMIDNDWWYMLSISICPALNSAWLSTERQTCCMIFDILIVQLCSQQCNQPCSENDSSHFQAHFCYHCFCLFEEELPKSQTRRSGNAPNDHPRPIIQWHPGTNPEASKEEPSNTISGTSKEGKSISNVSALRSKRHGNKPSQTESMEQPWHTS